MRAGLRRALLLFLLAPGAAHAQADPASWPARDAHEGLLVAADPYHDPARAKERFGKKHPQAAGILAIEVVFRNDNDKAIRLNLESISLLLSAPGQERQRLQPMLVEDVIERILYKGPPDATIPRKPLPIPGRIPKPGRSKQWLELEAKLRPLAFEMDILPPRSTVRGFLFFHVGRRRDWLSHTRLYLPDLKFLHNDRRLFFFEIELAKAAAR